MADPQVAALERRVELLEARKLKVADLPISALKSVLTSDRQDPVDSLLPKSVTSDLLSDDALVSRLKADSTAQGLELAAGEGSVVYAAPGGGFSTEQIITVDFENRTPKAVITTSEDRVITLGAHNRGPNTFTVWGWSGYGALAAGTYKYTWIALG